MQQMGFDPDKKSLAFSRSPEVNEVARGTVGVL